MDSSQIIFELQWKNKPGSAQIGIVWETTDEFLDFQTFKSYLGQNLGTLEDLSVSYIDNDGDEIPIESECEFKETLKFARQQAQNNQNVILRIEKLASSSPIMILNKPFSSEKLTEFKKQIRSKSDKIVKPKEAQELLSNSKIKPIIIKQKNFKLFEEKKEDMPKATGAIKKVKDKEEKPPTWFIKFMEEMKKEIVQEVTHNVMKSSKRLIEETHSKNCTQSPAPKKKVNDQEANEFPNTKDHKLFRKIEKLHKREKKLEKKLDLKLEKLENKTKKLMEKKNIHKQSLSNSFNSTPQNEAPVDDAIILNNPQTAIFLELGEKHTPTWQIYNNGGTIWKNDIELRLITKTFGLEVNPSVIQCPSLQPGQQGEITTTFSPPDFLGIFESNWNFFKNGKSFAEPIKVSLVVSKPSENENKKSEKHSLEKKLDISEKLTELNLVEENIPSLSDSEMEKINKNEMDDPNKIIEVEVASKALSLDSDTEDDNISVLSGSLSISDSENEDNFVFIPMPPCFTTDMSQEGCSQSEHLDDPKQDPIPTFSTSLNSDNNLHPQTFKENDSLPKENNDEEVLPQKKIYPINLGETSGGNTQPESTLHFDKYTKTNIENIYAIDTDGLCHPLESGWNINYSNTAESAEVQSKEKMNDFNCQQTSQPSTPSAPINENNTHGINSNSPIPPLFQASSVAILPETLIDGAISVASSAFSTAKTVFNNLRRPSDQETKKSSSGSAQRTQYLEILKEMGFKNYALNNVILDRHNNDINKAITELLLLYNRSPSPA